MKRKPIIIKTGLTYTKEAGKSQPGVDLDRYISDFLTEAGLPTFNNCCVGRDIIDPRLVQVLVDAGFVTTGSSSFTLVTDSSLSGDGTLANPLKTTLALESGSWNPQMNIDGTAGTLQKGTFIRVGDIVTFSMYCNATTVDTDYTKIINFTPPIPSSAADIKLTGTATGNTSGFPVYVGGQFSSSNQFRYRLNLIDQFTTGNGSTIPMTINITGQYSLV